jgi:hypothetical protein
VAVSPPSSVHEERPRRLIEGRHAAQVDDDVEVALGVDEVGEDVVDPRPVLEVDLAVDGHHDGAPSPTDGEPAGGSEWGSSVFGSCRGAPLIGSWETY